LIESLNTKSNFNGCFFSSDIGYIKPEAKYFEYVLKSISTSDGLFLKGKALFLDDALENVVAARDIGIPSVQITNGNELHSILDEILISGEN
jgi:FMN phosphatase YigB (HAD superfamily)